MKGKYHKYKKVQILSSKQSEKSKVKLPQLTR